MSKRPAKDMAASVRQRLMNVAKTTNRPFSEVLQFFALERWLYRLSQSKHSERFVLKGALLFVAWKTPASRPTRDIDLLGRLGNDLDSIRATIAEICRTKVANDGLIFNAENIDVERITEDADYEGVRATFQARLGNARIAMQIDIGFGDVITPAPANLSYPAILELPTAELIAYNRETAIAEKLEAMVKLGELNSRMKDFFDVALLAANFESDGRALAAAIRATFDRRQTELQTDPVCFSDRFANDPVKIAQWKAFTRRSLLKEAVAEFSEVVQQVRGFLRPVMEGLVSNSAQDKKWPPGGPWQY